MGSRLRTALTNLPAWDIPVALTFEFLLRSNENGIPEHHLLPTGRPDNYGMLNYYREMYRFFANNSFFPHNRYEVILFTYDWRLSSEHTAELLEHRLRGKEDVVLVAHSMGGLVASSFLARSQFNRNRVNGFYAFGTPFLGSSKAIEGFETGRILPSIIGVLTGGPMRRIAANTPSIFELMPTSRHGSFMHLPPEWRYPHESAFINGRTWARRADGTIKPMRFGALAFHNSLMVGSSHIANTVNAMYVIGTDIPTYHRARFERTGNDSYQLIGFDRISGDGTVTVVSASNERNFSSSNTILIPDGEHNRIQSNMYALERIRAEILNKRRSGTFSLENVELTIELPEKNITTHTGNFVSITVQGSSLSDIYDLQGVRIIPQDEFLFKLQVDGTTKRVGCLTILCEEAKRIQYVIDKSDFVLKNLNFDVECKNKIWLWVYEGWKIKAAYKLASDTLLSGQFEICSSDSTTGVSIIDVKSKDCIELIEASDLM